MPPLTADKHVQALSQTKIRGVGPGLGLRTVGWHFAGQFVVLGHSQRHFSLVPSGRLVHPSGNGAKHSCSIPETFFWDVTAKAVCRPLFHVPT